MVLKILKDLLLIKYMEIKRCVILIVALSFFACSNSNQKKEKKVVAEQSAKVEDKLQVEKKKNDKEKISFTNSSGDAVLIGEKIELLNADLKVVADISNLAGTMVTIKGVSDSLFDQSEDFCESFWYVKIQNDTMNGIVNGRQVFKVLKGNESEKFTIEGNCIEFLRTEFFGMGVAYQGDLMGCPVDQPILIKDTAHKYYGLVEMKANEFSKQASWGTAYPYFELKNDDGGYDHIDTLLQEGSKFKLKIHRGFQEGENDSDVLLHFEKGKYKAEYLNFGEVKYDY